MKEDEFKKQVEEFMIDIYKKASDLGGQISENMELGMEKWISPCYICWRSKYEINERN